jgi:hypothetical protein
MNSYSKTIYTCKKCLKEFKFESEAEDCCLIQFALIKLKNFTTSIDLDNKHLQNKFYIEFIAELQYIDPDSNTLIKYDMPTRFDFREGVIFWHDKKIINIG